MNLFRFAVSLFLAILIVVSALGWVWTGSHQAASQALASRTVLSLGMLGAIAGVWILWRRRT